MLEFYLSGLLTTEPIRSKTIGYMLTNTCSYVPYTEQCEYSRSLLTLIAAGSIHSALDSIGHCVLVFGISSNYQDTLKDMQRVCYKDIVIPFYRRHTVLEPRGSELIIV